MRNSDNIYEVSPEHISYNCLNTHLSQSQRMLIPDGSYFQKELGFLVYKKEDY